MQSFQPFGLQTGDDGRSARSSYATSMVYNDHNQEITILGGTYSNYFKPGNQQRDDKADSDCFVAIQDLRNPSRLAWVRRRQYGHPTVPEFCTDIQARAGGRYVAIGHAGEDSMLSQLLPYGDSRRTTYGMLLDIDESIELDGGNLFHSNEVQFPVAVATDESGDEIFVAEIFSETRPDASQQLSEIFSSEDGGPDASATAYSIPVIGLSFALRVGKLTIQDSLAGAAQSGGSIKGFHGNWSREYGALDMDNVQVSTLDYVSSSRLLLTGFTRGKGEALGEVNDSSVDTLDSFLMIMDPSDGQMLESVRMQSVLPGDDRILGTCFGDNTNEVYLVGMTSGLFDSKYVFHQPGRSTEHHVYAFIQKFSLEKMEAIWSRQVGAIFADGSDEGGRKSPQIHGLACAVTPDGEEVYMAGNVKDGASLAMPGGQSFVSSGDTDIFVTKFDVVSADLKFAAQIGSAQDDNLASKEALATDRDGNLIVLGNTNGSMYRDKETKGTTDIFTMSVGRESGRYLSPFDATISKEDRKEIDFFGVRYDDPVKQARYENIMAALLTLLCLVLALLCVAVSLCWKRTDGKIKGRAVERASVETCQSISEGSALDSTHSPLVSSVSLDTFGWSRGQETSVFSPVHPSIEPRQKPHCHVPETLTRTKIESGAEGYFGFEASGFLESTGSTPSTLGNPRTKPFASSAKNFIRPFLRETERNRAASRTGEDNKRQDDASSTYGEIYDLLSRASERLGLDADPDSDLDPAQAQERTLYGRKEEEMTLDDIWNMQVV